VTSSAGNGEVRELSSPQHRKVIMNRGPAGEDGIYIQGEVYGQILTMLIDTGSTVSILNIEAWQRLKQPGMKLQPHGTNICGVGGDQLATWGKREIPIKIGQANILQEMVVGACTDGVILGMDFLRQHVSRLDFPRLTMTIGEEDIDILYYNKPPEKSRVIAAGDLIVPARSEKLVTACVGAARMTEGLLTDDPTLTAADRGWIPAHALVTVRGGRVPVRIINVAETDLHLKKGSYLGYLESSGEIIPQSQPARRANSEEVDWTGYHKLRDLAERTTVGMDRQQKTEVEQLLQEYKRVFSDDTGSLGLTDLVQHEIHTGASPPIKQGPRRVPYHHREAVDQHIEEMLSKGVIEPSTSPWASPIVLVKKKDGSLRFCVDYRKLNAVTEKDAYPLPRIDETIEAFAGARWFSTLDLTSGYWQVGMTEEAKKSTRPENHRFPLCVDWSLQLSLGESDTHCPEASKTFPGEKPGAESNILHLPRGRHQNVSSPYAGLLPREGHRAGAASPDTQEASSRGGSRGTGEATETTRQ
jgi:hypothetical protein